LRPFFGSRRLKRPEYAGILFELAIVFLR